MIQQSINIYKIRLEQMAINLATVPFFSGKCIVHTVFIVIYKDYKIDRQLGSFFIFSLIGYSLSYN